MESLLLGLKEEEEDTKSSTAPRLVPWLNWNEWIFVKDALFSNSLPSVSAALNRISAWRSRGCLPVTIQVTASIIEIQLKDPWFRMVDQSNDASLSDEMLAMLYCMAIMRLVNGVVEKTRKKELVSIAVAADAIGIPRMLIDVRHGRQVYIIWLLFVVVYIVVRIRWNGACFLIAEKELQMFSCFKCLTIGIAEGSHRELPSLKVVPTASVKALDWLKSYY